MARHPDYSKKMEHHKEKMHHHLEKAAEHGEHLHELHEVAKKHVKKPMHEKKHK